MATTKYIDATGLAHLWGRINSNTAAKVAALKTELKNGTGDAYTKYAVYAMNAEGVKDTKSIPETYVKLANYTTDSEAINNKFSSIDSLIDGINDDIAELYSNFNSGIVNKALGDADGNDIRTTYIKTTQKGAANGVAPLGNDGKIAASYLPGYVDDIIEGSLYQGKFYTDSTHTTEITGESGKVYVDTGTNKTYRWSGTQFTEISASLALGDVSGTAFPGERGKALEERLDGVDEDITDLYNNKVDVTATGTATGAESGQIQSVITHNLNEMSFSRKPLTGTAGVVNKILVSTKYGISIKAQTSDGSVVGYGKELLVNGESVTINNNEVLDASMAMTNAEIDTAIGYVAS